MTRTRMKMTKRMTPQIQTLKKRSRPALSRTDQVILDLSQTKVPPAYVLRLYSDEDHEDGDDDVTDQVCNGTGEDTHTGEVLGSASAGEEESLPDEDEEPGTSGVSPLSSESKSLKSPLSDIPLAGRSPVHPESTQIDSQEPAADGEVADSEEPLEPRNPTPGVAVVTEDGPSLPLSPEVVLDNGCEQISNGTSPSRPPTVSRSQKRKREGRSADGPQTADRVQDR